MFLGLLLACSKRKEEGHTEMKREDIANMLLSPNVGNTAGNIQ